MADEMIEEQIQRSWEAYTDAWSDVDAEERARLVGLAVTEGVEFSNPQVAGRGREKLIKVMEGFQAQFPGAYFELTSAIIHHGQLLSAWVLRGKDGSELMTGHNYARADAAGKLDVMAGFFKS